jgi:anti-sigma regulatory factor (Ser/Thr protein kinase)
MESQNSWHVFLLRNVMELVLIAIVGSLVVSVVEGLRYNSSLLKLIQETSLRQRIFFRDVLASVTERRLWLCHDADELPPALTPYERRFRLTVEDVHSLRHAARDAAVKLNYPDGRQQDLVTGVGEAAMNAVVHAGGGEGFVSIDPRGTVQVRIEDCGGGIKIDQLPQATLERGYTTAGSLGHGFWIMLNTIDRISLLTGTTGTTIVLEQDRDPTEPSWIRKY